MLSVCAGETHMKMLHRSIFCFALLLVVLPALHAQDLSTYRSCSLGTNLPAVLKQTGLDISGIQVLYEHPALIQELTWWPLATPVSARRRDTVEQIRFSFFNSELYKISVVYDRRAVEGLTDEDMVQSISALYGPATNVAVKVDPPPDDRYDVKQQLIASWEDSHFCIQLLRNPFADGFGLILFSKRANAQAQAAIVEATRLEAQERPQKEADQRKKEAADLELLRQKNKQVFQP